ncbi:MAG: DUF465 domain-containing protein [Hellea sp.]
MSDDFEPNADAIEDPAPVEPEAVLETLKLEHRRIDTEIKAMIETGVSDMLKIGRMKKVKLALKDKIAYLENQITPDIIA